MVIRRFSWVKCFVINDQKIEINETVTVANLTDVKKYVFLQLKLKSRLW